jgi:hypothetical protein
MQTCVLAEVVLVLVLVSSFWVLEGLWFSLAMGLVPF